MQPQSNMPLQPIPPWVNHRVTWDTLSMLQIQSMCSEPPRYTEVTATLGLFSDLMKFTVVNERLSINNLMFYKENSSTVSMYYQQNEKSAQKSLSCFLLILPNPIVVTVSPFCIFAAFIHVFVLLPLCLTDSVFSKFVHLSVYMMCGRLV